LGAPPPPPPQTSFLLFLSLLDTQPRGKDPFGPAFGHMLVCTSWGFSKALCFPFVTFPTLAMSAAMTLRRLRYEPGY